jgi:ribonuclease PH
MRKLTFETNYTEHAEGSVLIHMGKTQVLCTAMTEERVPRFLLNTGKGWVTAEYGMVPSATQSRYAREARRGGGVKGRTSEIQRLIGRALRAGINLEALGERTIYIDCDVIQADGGTRCASINGGFTALSLACRKLVKDGLLSENPIHTFVAAVSVAVCGGTIVIDPDYEHDSSADVDMNVVMDEHGRLIEIQGTAEGQPFSRAMLSRLVASAGEQIKRIVKAQHKALGSE